MAAKGEEEPRERPRKTLRFERNETAKSVARDGSDMTRKGVMTHRTTVRTHDQAPVSTRSNNLRAVRGNSELQEDENPVRTKVRDFLQNTYVDSSLSLVIVANVVLMVAETNHNAFCEDSNPHSSCQKGSGQMTALAMANIGFQALYTIECALRLFADRWRFFKSRWNLLDITIVFLGYVDMILVEVLSGKEIPGPGVAILRIFRIARLLRVARILSFFPELYVMIRGFVGAMMAMFWGMFIIACLLMIWAILGVELIHPTSVQIPGDEYDEYCKESFSSVQTCMLIFFQTVFAGDSWGYCAIPVIKREPALFLIFAGTLITIQLGFTNLVLAVIVERATKASEKDGEERARERMEWHAEARYRLKKLFKDQIDQDGSETITLDEMTEGYRNVKELRDILTLMDIEEDDLKQMIELLADDGGEVPYMVLVDNLETCESGDMRWQTMLMSLQVERIRKDVLDLAKESKLKKRQTLQDIPSQQVHALAELQAVQQEARSDLQETLHGLEKSLDAQWLALERRLDKQVQAQVATLSQHTHMLTEIAAATGCAAAEPEPKDVENGRSDIAPLPFMKSRGSIVLPSQMRVTQMEDPAASSDWSRRKRKNSKQSSKSVKRENTTLSRNAARWAEKKIPGRPGGQ